MKALHEGFGGKLCIIFIMLFGFTRIESVAGKSGKHPTISARIIHSICESYHKFTVDKALHRAMKKDPPAFKCGWFVWREKCYNKASCKPFIFQRCAAKRSQNKAHKEKVFHTFPHGSKFGNSHRKSLADIIKSHTRSPRLKV